MTLVITLNEQLDVTSLVLSIQPIPFLTYLNARQLSFPESQIGLDTQRKSLHLVAAKQAPEPPNTRLSVGDYIADILLDARPDGTIYHWIVQRVGSAAIIQWGQEYTFEDAHAERHSYLENLSSTARKKRRPLFSFRPQVPEVRTAESARVFQALVRESDGANQFKNHRSLALGAPWELLILQKGNFVWEAVRPMSDSVYSALRHDFICPKGATLDHFPRRRL